MAGWSQPYNAYFPTQTYTPSPPIVTYRSPVQISLTLDNSTTNTVSGQMALKLYDLNNKLVSEEGTQLTLEPGTRSYKLSVKKVPNKTKTEDFVKYNLNYAFNGGGITVTGTENLFQLADKAELRIRGEDTLYAGQNASVNIHAFVHGQPDPISNATVSIKLLEGSNEYALYSGSTDTNGFTNAQLTIPDNLLGPAKIKTTINTNLGTETIIKDVSIIRSYKILLTTDKPIYQPGQTIHIRTLTLSRPDLLPAQNKQIIIECEDSKGNKVFRVEREADEFGVVSADFVLGTDINMGLYTVRAVCDPDGDSTSSEKKVNVERYVLPKFRVDLQTDSDYYTPGSIVGGTIHTKYFFGKSVSNAEVIIEAYKFDVELVLFQTISGETDHDGFFAFQLTLPAYFVGIPLDQGDAFVKLDIKVTDTADHTESIIRELTVTRDPIHIQIVPESNKIIPGIENILYITTTDPIGRGIQTSNNITVDDQTFTVDTDNHGLGSFNLTPDVDTTMICSVTSHGNGQVVETLIDLSASLENDKILLRPDKAIYTVGQTMEIAIFVSETIGRRVFVDIIRDRQTLLTKTLDIVDGQGMLAIDLSADMAGSLLIDGYYISIVTETASDVFRDEKIVYVNPADELSVSASLDKTEYLPGEQAVIEFQVLPPQPTALGVTIVDEAVFALQENRPGLLKIYFNMEKDIMIPRYWPLIVPFEEAVTTPDPEDQIQEITRIAFASNEELPEPGLNDSTYPGLVQRMKEVMVDRIDKDAEKIAKDLGNMDIYSPYSYSASLSSGTIKTYLDPWGIPYILDVGYSEVTLLSSGPDKIRDNIDDFSYTKSYELKYTPIFIQPQWPMWGFALGGSLYSSAYTSGYSGYFSGSTTQDQTAGVDVGSGSLNPYSPPSTPSPETPKESVQEPRKIRRDFPETMLWEPSLITDPNGYALMDTNMPDSITTWRMSTVASTHDGKLGGSTDGIVVFQDFFVDIDLPVALTQNDEISIPVAIYNYLEVSQTVTVRLEVNQDNPWFLLMDEQEKLVNLEAGEITSVYFRIKALLVGWHELTVFGYGTTMSDAIARKIEVLPDGMEYNVSVSDFLDTSTVSHNINIPVDAIDGASKILLKVYPGIFSQIVEGLDKLIKVPYG